MLTRSSHCLVAVPTHLQHASVRGLHAASALATKPLPSAFAKYVPPVRKPREGLELLAARHAAPVITNNYNERIFGASPAQPAANPKSNTQLTMALLLKALQEARKSKSTGNVIISPVSMAKSLQASGAAAFSEFKLQPQALKAALETDYAALLQQWERSGDVTLAVSSHAGKEAGESFARTVSQLREQEAAMKKSQMAHMVELPFPLHEQAAAQNPAASAVDAGVQSSLSFHGYLAPRFTSPDTPFPNYFYDYAGGKRIAHMMVRTARTWYVEAEHFQMIDLPYLNPNFVATLVLPRYTSDRTIQDHPDEFKYDQAPRTPATVDQLLTMLATPMKNGGDVFSHHAKHMSLLPGLVGVPGFTADSVVAGQRSVLALSPHGLDVGAKTPRQRTKVEANFAALVDHPFLFFVRSVDPAQPHIVFAAVVSDVLERKDFATRFPLPVEWRNYKELIADKVKQLYEKAL